MMNQIRQFMPWTTFDPKEVVFALGQDRGGKPAIHVLGQVALVSPASVTNWPRVTGQGNFGTMFGPTDPTKGKFTLDLTDASINGGDNEGFKAFMAKMDELDNKLLEFIHANQLRILGRKNLTLDEVKMLQIRTNRPKYDKATGTLVGHTIQLSTGTYQWDGMGSKVPRVLPIVDFTGQVLTTPTVNPGDVVAACMYINQVYTNVGGDKFGIHWAMNSVQVVCQRAAVPSPTEILDFGAITYEFAKPYEGVKETEVDPMELSSQFPNEGTSYGNPINVA